MVQSALWDSVLWGIEGDYPPPHSVLCLLFRVSVVVGYTVSPSLLPLHGMAGTIQDDLRRQMVLGYYGVLRRTRKRIKGLKLVHLWSVEILGCNPSGVSVSDMARAEGLAKSSIIGKLRPAMCAGFVCKDGTLYKLTDKGREAFAILEEEFSAELEKIVEGILSEVRRRNK